MCVCVCVCEKVTVEIQIHEHSTIVSQWDFFARFFVRCSNIVGPISKKRYNITFSWCNNTTAPYKSTSEREEETEKIMPLIHLACLVLSFFSEKLC